MRQQLLRKTPMKRGGKLRAYSPARHSEMSKYRKEAEAFIAGHLADRVDRWCPVALAGKIVVNKKTENLIPVMDVHHKKGRHGKLLRDQRWWLAVSRLGHEWIHANPREARRLGWLI